MNKELETLIAYLMHSRTQTQVFHLQTRSYAEHIALGTYYGDIVDLLDGLIESYQGRYGIIKDYENFKINPYTGKPQLETYLKAMSKKVNDTHGKVKETFIQNQLDTIDELINSTLYKIKFLG
jgi:hypothetical protein